jgi:hypothetical protein
VYGGWAPWAPQPREERDLATMAGSVVVMTGSSLCLCMKPVAWVRLQWVVGVDMYVGCFLIFINPIPLISILYVRVRGISGCSLRVRFFFGEGEQG